MIPKIRYDFKDFEQLLGSIKVDPTHAKMRELKNELNMFFRDAKCKEVIYTNNTDKLFFGMCVMPDIPGDAVYDIIQGDEPYRISSYYLELDSKLFSPMLDLSAKELTAVLLHEVGHIVKDTTPIDTVRKNVDIYLSKSDASISVTDSIHYKEILNYGIKDAIRKVTSLFEKNNDELIADEFVVACGYGEHLESAFEKLLKNSFNINKDVDNKIVVLSWVLRLYSNVKLQRISAIRSLEKGKNLTASKIEKNEMQSVIARLNRIDDDSLISEGVFDDLKAKYNAGMRQIRYKGIRSYEDDLYEYSVRIKNDTSEDDALIILHQINARMNVIEDYINTEENLSDNDKKRWYGMYDKYNKLRDILSNKTVYKNDYRRLYITYPDMNK